MQCHIHRLSDEPSFINCASPDGPSLVSSIFAQLNHQALLTMHPLTLLLSCLVLTIAQAGFIVHDKRESIGHEWEKRERAGQDLPIPVRIALAQRNLDKAYDYLMEVSDPDSENYGR